MCVDAEFFKNLLSLQENMPIDLYFVGGCIRNLVLGLDSNDIDFIVMGDFDQFIERLTALYPISRSKIKTAHYKGTLFTYDFAAPRRDFYPNYDGVPNVIYNVTLLDDLERRDFTVNTGIVPLSEKTMAWFTQLKPKKADVLKAIQLAHPHFWSDIDRRFLRALHKASYKEDPSRYLRAIKYMTLYKFRIIEDQKSIFNPAVEILSLNRGRFLKILWQDALEPSGEHLLCAYSQYNLIPDFRDFTKLFFEMRPVFGAVYGLWPYVYFLWAFNQEFTLLRNLDSYFTPLIKEIECVEKWEAPAVLDKNGYEIYKMLYNMRVESLMSCALTDIKKDQIIYFMTHLASFKVTATGYDLIRMGIPRGPEIGKLLEMLLKYKLDHSLRLSYDDELLWIKGIYENRDKSRCF